MTTVASTIKTLYRTNLPEGGFDLTGTGKQNKQMVIAQLVNLNYDNDMCDFSPKSLGLNTIDFVTFQVRVWKSTATPPDTYPITGTGNQPFAVWNSSTNKLLVFPADTGTIIGDNSSVEIRILAVGDSAVTAELL